MKDFDQETLRAERVKPPEERQFVIGGETFTHRIAVAPEALVPWNRAITREVELTEAAWLTLYDETILALLEGGQDERWREVRQPGRENPLTLTDMKAVLSHLIEQVSGRPTTPPPVSSNGGGGTATTSKDASSSPEAPASVS